MTAEEKIIEKIRKSMLANATITGYVKTRVYAAHISTIDEPRFPAISIHCGPASPYFALPGMVNLSLQIDIWLPSADYTLSDVMTIIDAMRSTLHRQNLIDTTIGVNIAQCIEVSSGPTLIEQDSRLLHYPVNYSVVGA